MSVHVPPDDAGAPRAQAGPNPQHLLATLLGEYLDSSEAGLPSTAVVAMLGEFGISESSARAALSRLTKRGLIAVRGSGRPPVYHLTPQAIARHRSRMDHFLGFGAHPPQWTGDWVTVSFSIPQSGQAQSGKGQSSQARSGQAWSGQAPRHAVRKALGSLGFARLYDSVWIRPGSDAGPVTQALHDILDEVDGGRWSVMHTRFDEETGPHGPAAAYDLAGLAAAYEAFIAQYSDLRVAVRDGEIDASRALVARTSVMDSWRRFPDIDPNLPEHLLPAPWPRQTARDLMLEIHSALGSLAEARLIQVATPYWPDAASWITHFHAAENFVSARAGGDG
ncbi:PaaX family transcriptional regulator [Microbispora bryophytorum]|uniref:PaaX family transcriptional regulator n=1 Tax=Microbispora bryophytorum TaxID=1460882 RepID=UPI001158AD93|nr:PaaX family transcriptional regulator C-terminal domain-containing protein [Microbispora bryophytorum]MBD3140107.1 PaaX family transcriptional regulator [Microbispora bryophytorum]TQS04867.1 PaaX family transcriptional regulator [Microbispora bryophytorum]